MTSSMKNAARLRSWTVAAWAFTAVAGVWAQGLPALPESPAPVRNYEYDAQGNPTKTITAPGAAGFGFETKASYDSLSRVKDTTDAKLGKTEFGYDGLDRTTLVKDPRGLSTQYPRNGLGDATQLISPDTGTATHTYDAAGNLITRTDSRGVLATYTYDALNRLRTVVYSQTGQTSETTSWGFDNTGTGYANGIGRLTRTDHPSGTSRYVYDAQGRLTEYVQALTAKSGANASAVLSTVKYGYNAAGKLTSVTYPSGRQVTYTLTDGEVSAVNLAKDVSTAATPLITQIQWEPFGGVRSWQWQMSSGVQAHERWYDTYGRLVRYRLGDAVRDLTYDEADRIKSYRHYLYSTGAAQTALDQDFGYDELGRLTSVTMGTASWAIAYDANGNRTSVTLNGTPSVYATATTSNRLLSTTNPARTFGYDNAGNTTSDTGGYTSTYNLANRLTTLTKGGVTNTYSYDANGQRVRKYSAAGTSSTVIFVYDQGGQLLGEYSSTGAALREYVWLGSTPIAMFTPDAVSTNPPVAYYFHTDHLDTPRIVFNKAGAKRWRWLAEPFGTTAPETNPDSLGVFTQNLRFPGQYADQESGLSYNYFRDYDSSTGRYVQSDPVGLDGGINTYAYVQANPATLIDPNGHNAVLAASRAFNIGWKIGELINPVVQPVLATLIDQCVALSENKCDPPEGTICSEFHEKGTPHKVFDIDGTRHPPQIPHVHTWKMNKTPGGQCIWNKRSKDTFNYTPINARSCSSFQSWLIQNGS